MVCPFSLCGRLPSWGNPVGAEIGSISEQQLVRPSGFICWVTDRGYQADKKICKIVALTVRKPRVIKESPQVEPLAIIHRPTIRVTENSGCIQAYRHYSAHFPTISGSKHLPPHRECFLPLPTDNLSSKHSPMQDPSASSEHLTPQTH